LKKLLKILTSILYHNKKVKSTTEILKIKAILIAFLKIL